MSAPKVDSQAPAKAKNACKRALSTSEAAASPSEARKPAKRAKATTSKNVNDKVDLTGPFDLLYTHPSFVKEYAPNGTEEADHVTRPEELYKMLLARQEGGKESWTSQITIPANYKTLGHDIEFKNTAICDPMSDCPYELVANDFKDVAKPKFTTKYDRPTLEQGACNAPGIKASLEIEGGGGCGIGTNSGTFSLRPLWKKVGEDGKAMELFEGKVTFKVKFSSMYSKRGFGTGANYSFEFWAIRGKN